MTEVSTAPEDPETEWWSLARQSPVFALEQPMSSLCLLAAPERWIALEADCAESWIRAGLEWLNQSAIHRLIADCVESLLPHYEKGYFPFIYQGDSIVREAIAVRRMEARAACRTETYRLTMTKVGQREVELCHQYERHADSALFISSKILGAVNGHHSDFFCMKQATRALTYVTRGCDRDAARTAAWVSHWRRFLRYAQEVNLLTTNDGKTP